MLTGTEIIISYQFYILTFLSGLLVSAFDVLLPDNLIRHVFVCLPLSNLWWFSCFSRVKEWDFIYAQSFHISLSTILMPSIAICNVSAFTCVIMFWSH